MGGGGALLSKFYGLTTKSFRMDQFYMQFDASNHLDKYLLILRCFDVGGPERVKQELDLDWSL